MLIKVVLSALIFCLGRGFCVAGQAEEARPLRLAPTTSTENSGLLAYLLPEFEREAGLKVHVIAVGTGKALKLGENGDVDVVLVHDPELEEAFMKSGFGFDRRRVMYNDFVVAGPAADPAGLRKANSARKAFQKLGRSGARFVSRGDESGTHQMEKRLWKAAKVQPKGDWYVEAGQGMGQVLLMADEMGAYTLTDRATYLKLKPKLRLEALFQGDRVLFNQYSVIPVNPAHAPGVSLEGAQKFARWLVAPRTQQRIAAFGRDTYGQALFVPNAK